MEKIDPKNRYVEYLKSHDPCTLLLGLALYMRSENPKIAGQTLSAEFQGKFP